MFAHSLIRLSDLTDDKRETFLCSTVLAQWSFDVKKEIKCALNQP